MSSLGEALKHLVEEHYGHLSEKAYAERFIGSLRDKCLNENWFMNLKHARDIIED